jgi:hypothetical protein
MAWNELVTPDAGRMSLGVIVSMLGMAAVMYVRFRAFIREASKDERRPRRAGADQPARTPSIRTQSPSPVTVGSPSSPTR